MTRPVSCFLVLSALFGEWMRRGKSFESRTRKVQKKASIFLAASLLFFFVVLFPCLVGALSQSREERTLSELQIEELMGLKVATVYGASKFEQKVTDAPSAVSIVTSDDIKKFGYRTLADILRSQRGFYITNDRNYQYVGIAAFLARAITIPESCFWSMGIGSTITFTTR